MNLNKSNSLYLISNKIRLGVFCFLAILPMERDAFAIIGCLKPLEELAPRADIVLIGRITAVRQINGPACSETRSVPLPVTKKKKRKQKKDANGNKQLAAAIENYAKENHTDTENSHSNCGNLFEFDVENMQTLRGEITEKLTVLIGNSSAFNFPCDDRSPPGKMAGMYAILFIERYKEGLWLVSGADSVYGAPVPIDKTRINEVAAILKTHPRAR